jgi:hypothetical protein
VSDSPTGRLGIILVAVSVIVALLGMAPFTGALFLIGVLLPAAAVLAYRGAVASGLLTLAIGHIAMAMSPLKFQQFVTEMPMSFAWVVLCSIAVIVCAVRGVRQRLLPRQPTISQS